MTGLLSARELAQALGGRQIGRGQWMAPCVAHQERTGSLSIRDGYSGPLLHCFGGCSQQDVISALQERGLWPKRDRPQEDRPAAAPPPRTAPRPSADPSPDLERAQRIGLARRIWREAGDPRGTLAETFLQSRELEVTEDLIGRVLRFHGSCPFGRDGKDQRLVLPCLVAAFMPIEGEQPDEDSPQAIQRIGLDPEQDGYQVGKLSLGPTAGAAIKIDADEDVLQGLALTEGLVTGMSVRAIGIRPVWACGSAGAMGTFPLLAGVGAITCYADNDESGTGEKKAQECATRWRLAGKEARVFVPRGRGNDWGDEWSIR